MCCVYTQKKHFTVNTNLNLFLEGTNSEVQREDVMCHPRSSQPLGYVPLIANTLPVVITTALNACKLFPKERRRQAGKPKDTDILLRIWGQTISPNSYDFHIIYLIVIQKAYISNNISLNHV